MLKDEGLRAERAGSLDWGLRIILKDAGSQSPGTSSPFPVPHPERTQRPSANSHPLPTNSEASPSLHLRVPALGRGWKSPEALSSGAEVSRDSPWPLGASVSPLARGGGRPGRSPSALLALTLWGSRCAATAAPTWGGAPGPRGRAVGGREGNGHRPELPGAFKEEKRAEGGAGRVCAGERLASGLGGWKPTLRRGTVAGRPTWPAPQPRRPRLACAPCAAWAAGPRPRRSPAERPTPAPTALSPGLRAAASSARTTSTVFLGPAGHPEPLQSPQPQDRLQAAWHLRAEDLSGRDGGLVPVPTPLRAPGLELLSTSGAGGGRDTAEPRSALSRRVNRGRPGSRTPLPGQPCPRCPPARSP